MKANKVYTEEQTREVGERIMQQWRKLNQEKENYTWEHKDRIKAITEFTENALKVAGIQAVGNLVGDIVQIATRKIPTGSTKRK